MKFAPHTETDFLKNEYFVQWVLSPTKESSQYWERWLSQHPDKVELMGAARDLLLSFEQKDPQSMDETSYFKILDTLLEENSKQKEQGMNERPGSSRSWIFAAASIILFSGLFLVGFLSQRKDKPADVVIDYLVESVPKGLKKTITLPDGSVVKLNADSELKYPSRFSDTLREVYLTGQAFFEVTKSEKDPFVVHTQYFSTRVLGTSFDIRSYENESINHVAVLTGKVQVRALSGQEKLLTPRDMTTYDMDKKSLIKSTYNPDVLLSWRKGIISFDHADFSEVTTCLSRWYGVQFIVEKGFEVKGSYTGHFDKEALVTVLKGISYSSHFSYRVDGKTIFIKPN